MSNDAMPVPFLHKILYIIDFLACSLYIYIITYLIINQGSALLQSNPEQMDFFCVVGIAFFGWIGNFRMLRGRIRGLFFCYINWFLSAIFFAYGFFYTGIIFPAIPKAIPSYIIPSEWLAGDIFHNIVSVRGGFLGLYLATIIKTTSVYSYFSKIQREQLEKDRSGESIGSFRRKMDIPDSPYENTPLLYQNAHKKNIEETLAPKKRSFFRKLVSAFMIFFLLSTASGIGIYFFSPESYEKLYQKAQTYLPVLKQKIETLVKNFSDSSEEKYRALLKNKIILNISSENQGKKWTISEAVEEICFLTKVPYVDTKIEGSEEKIGTLISHTAKASSLLDILLSPRQLQYAFCPKGLYLKREKENVDWSLFSTTKRTAQFLPSSK